MMWFWVEQWKPPRRLSERRASRAFSDVVCPQGCSRMGCRGCCSACCGSCFLICELCACGGWDEVLMRCGCLW